jgi:alpha-L-fucosidase
MRQARRLSQVGKWLARYGESIYATRGGPCKAAPWGGSTYRGNTVYLHILDWREDTLILPAIDRSLVAARSLTGGTVKLTQTESAIELSVSLSDRKALDTIIALQSDERACVARR